MRVLIISMFLFTLLGSCKKIIEDKQRTELVSIITSGQWHIESFTEGTNITTAQFQGYNFQFTENGAVYGSKDTLVVTGNWTGDLTNYSISSNFPDADEPLKKLNGTWKIKDSSNSYVAAEMKTSQGIVILHLRKNP
jgi:hypothetical protein